MSGIAPTAWRPRQACGIGEAHTTLAFAVHEARAALKVVPLHNGKTNITGAET
jgi:hypothetical protein